LPQGSLSPSRLKIIEAHFGVEGINDPDVTHYLLERLNGNSFAEPIGTDLFHGFDPVSGNPNKRLKVRYSFDGHESTITRPEYGLLVLPEDKFLKAQVGQCEEEGRIAAAKANKLEAQSTIFSSLQMDALGLSAKLLDFIEQQGSPPVPKYTAEEIRSMALSKSRSLIESNDRDYDFACEFHFGGRDEAAQGDWSAVRFQTQMMARISLLDPWYEKVRASYALSKLGEEVKRMRDRFAVEGLVENDLNLPIEGAKARENIKKVAAYLWGLAYKIREKGIYIEDSSARGRLENGR
jgi:hypothetical protein